MASARLAHCHLGWLLCFLCFQSLEKTDSKNHRNFITKHLAFFIPFQRISVYGRTLNSYRDEIKALVKAASENVHDHDPLVTDTELLDETKKLLHKLERVEPEPEEICKNTQKEEATDHPGIQELRLYVRKVIGSENHNRYIAAMQCAQLSAEHYISELK